MTSNHNFHRLWGGEGRGGYLAAGLTASGVGPLVVVVTELVSSPGIVFLQAYLHTRMRARTSDLLKVLNRARPESKSTEKKTIS